MKFEMSERFLALVVLLCAVLGNSKNARVILKQLAAWWRER